MREGGVDSFCTYLRAQWGLELFFFFFRTSTHGGIFVVAHPPRPSPLPQGEEQNPVKMEKGVESGIYL